MIAFVCLFISIAVMILSFYYLFIMMIIIVIIIATRASIGYHPLTGGGACWCTVTPELCWSSQSPKSFTAMIMLVLPSSTTLHSGLPHFHCHVHCVHRELLF